MTQNTGQTRLLAASYDAVAEKFSGEAKSLISDSAIGQILAEEKIRFDNADVLQIPPSRLVKNNTLRYCKDLLRKKQPLPFLYSALCFLTEVSIIMLLYGAAIGIYSALSEKKGGVFAPFSFLYALILFTGMVGYNTLSQKYFLKILSIPFAGKKPTDTEIKERKNMFMRSRLRSLIIILALMTPAAASVYLSDGNNVCHAKLYYCFYAYVTCMVLLGIHNVVYNSHLISFFAIGGLLVTGHPADEISAAADQYLRLSYEQLLSLSHKTLEDCIKNPELEDKLRTSVHSRMTTGRIYYVLAIFICLVLDVICIRQLGHAAPALLIFFAASALLTMILIVAVLSANYILKLTKPQNPKQP